MRRQFAERPGIMNFTEKPDYARCALLLTVFDRGAALHVPAPSHAGGSPARPGGGGGVVPRDIL